MKMKAQNEITDSEKRIITDEIRTVVNNFLNPNTLNLESHIALRADVDGYVMGSDGKILYPDFNSYKEGISQTFETFERFTQLKCMKIFVYVLAPDAASCTTEFEGKVLTKDGDTFIWNGCWTFVFKKFGNTWKVVQENGTHTHE
jgi:hypothetical protein